MNRTKNGIIRYILSLCFAMTLAVLLLMLFCMGNTGAAADGLRTDLAILDRYDNYITNSVSQALDGILVVDRAYWLDDREMVAPEPDPDKFGETQDPTQLQWLLDEAESLLKGQDTLFTTQTVIKEDSKVKYYLDETIFTVTWKQVIDNVVYTMSEVKIADPTQFRRFLAGGEYGSGVLYTTTEMAESVNAVTASSGDYYSYRQCGIIVNNGQVHRSVGRLTDTCFIDRHGDLQFTMAKEIDGQEASEAFVAEHGVRFSLSFGPLMVRNGEVCTPNSYNLGQIDDKYARAALCQLDKLHYLLVTVNMENPYTNTPNIHTFAQQLKDMGIPTAYALDGGQTAVIVTGDERMNSVNYGSERKISDIIYFATAVPSGT